MKRVIKTVSRYFTTHVILKKLTDIRRSTRTESRLLHFHHFLYMKNLLPVIAERSVRFTSTIR